MIIAAAVIKNTRIIVIVCPRNPQKQDVGRILYMYLYGAVTSEMRFVR